MPKGFSMTEQGFAVGDRVLLTCCSSGPTGTVTELLEGSTH